MAILVQDTFQRATTAGSTTISNAAGFDTSSDGNTWSSSSTTPTFSIANPASNFLSGAATGSTNDEYMVLSTNTYADVECVARVRSTSGAAVLVGFCARYASANQQYLGYLNVNGASGQVAIEKNVSGTFTSLKTTTMTASANTWYWIRFRVKGSTLTLTGWAGGTSESSGITATITDTAITAAGKVGLYMGLDVTGTVVYWNQFQVNDTTVTSVAVSPTDGLTATDVLLSTDGFTTVEANTVSDLLGNLQSWPIEANTLADFPGGAMQSWPIGATTSTSTLFSSLTAVPIESTTASSLLLGTFVPLPVDANTLSDIGGGSLQRWPVDALTAVSSPLDWEIYQPSEGLVVSETIAFFSAPPPTEHTYPFTDQLTPTVLGGVMQRWPVELTTIVSRLLTNDELHTSTVDIYALRAFSGPVRITGTTGGNELTITELINFFSMKLPSEVVAIIMTTRDGLLTMTTRDAEISLTARNGESLSALTRDGIGATTKSRDGLAGTIKTRG